MAIVHVPDAVIRSAQRDRLPNEGAADAELVTAEGDAPLVLDSTHLVARGVLDGRQAAGERARARSVSRGRCRVIECFVRPAQVVDGAPVIERALHVREALPGWPPRQHLQGERAMEPFLFALRLRMIGTSVQDRNAERDEPGGEPGVLVQRVAAPRGAI